MEEGKKSQTGGYHKNQALTKYHWRMSQEEKDKTKKKEMASTQN